MSMLKICGQELELDLFDADTMEVYEKSMDKVVKRAEERAKSWYRSVYDVIGLYVKNAILRSSIWVPKLSTRRMLIM